MKFDLHSHSHYSDGKHAPEFLIERAIQNGVTHLAITDHDCIHALAQYEKNPPEGLTLINGVEISCQWEGLEIHLIGLEIDLQSPGLLALLASQQQRRRHRIEQIASLIKQHHKLDLLDYFAALPCVSLTRSHVADFMVEKGLCKNRQKVFKRYLGKGAKYYIKAQWCSLNEAIGTIQDAGGIAVIAHPSRYPLGTTKLRRLLSDFANGGGDAMEVSYSNLDSITIGKLAKLCLEFKLWASVGSDFHTSETTWLDIGKMPALPPSCKKNAIWNHPRWHSISLG
ncbi:MAG: phosphatase [SAR86 cluster bacterium]|uniref:Phosphatase n=1 Tax=SAR86 cluster bacterium TaxID=2030880 RepID=A0A2A4MPB5_9GAMM|nr:MAG: phosphatase [SAR86 cluster bacterium]